MKPFSDWPWRKYPLHADLVPLHPPETGRGKGERGGPCCTQDCAHTAILISMHEPSSLPCHMKLKRYRCQCCIDKIRAMVRPDGRLPGRWADLNLKRIGDLLMTADNE